MRRLAAVLREQAGFALVLLVIAAALIWLLILPTHWRRGVGVIAGALLLAAVLRVVLPASMRGNLVVRRTWLDTAIYAGLGVLVLVIDIRLRTH